MPARKGSDPLAFAKQRQTLLNAQIHANNARIRAEQARAQQVGAEAAGSLPCGTCRGFGRLLVDLTMIGMRRIAAFAKVFPRDSLPRRVMLCEHCNGTGRSQLIGGRVVVPNVPASRLMHLPLHPGA